MIDVANKWEDGDMKEGLVITIANHMKKCFLNWNKDTVDDKVIFNHLFELSEGKIDIRNSDEELSNSEGLLKNKRHYKKNFKKNKNPRKRNRN
jgi:hypothetical protein